jgi:hypothetical protein
MYLWINSIFHFRDCINCLSLTNTGADPGFQVMGGGALKKFASSGGRREHFWGISCEKSRIYAKKSYFFQLRREARTFLGYFVWKIKNLRQKIIFSPTAEGGANIFGVFRVKNHNFMPKYHIFSNFRGDACRVCPPGSTPAINNCFGQWISTFVFHSVNGRLFKKLNWLF